MGVSVGGTAAGVEDGGGGGAARRRWAHRPSVDKPGQPLGRGAPLSEVVAIPAERLLLKVEEAASATGWSRAFIYEAIRAGDLKVVRYGRSTRIRPSDLQAFIDALVVTGAA